MAPEGETTVNGIVLSAPVAGAELVQQVAPGATVDLGNLMEQVTSLGRDGNNFILSFENGGKITLENFFPADAPEGTPTESTAAAEPEASAGPSLIIDGQEVPYSIFMANYGDSIEAAAGPATATAVAAAAGTAGSGIGSYADGAGSLIDGLGRLGKLGIISWENPTPYRVEDTGMGPSNLSVSFDQLLAISSSSVNESEEGFSVFLRLAFPQATDTTVTLNVSGNATFLNSLVGEDGYRADLALPAGFTLTQLPNGTWNITVVIPAGSTGIGINFPLVDDHITELNPEAISITVVDIQGNVTGIGATATINIVDDYTTHASHAGSNETGVLDGPIVGVINVTDQQPHDPVDPDPEYMRDTPDSSHSQEGSSGFNFQITLTDPHNLNEYAGYKGDNLLSQDLTIVLKPGMGDTATYGKDYKFNLDELLAIPGVKSAEVSDDGTITIVLSGRVNENGVPYPPNSPIFNLNDVPGLIIKAEIVDDRETELNSEELTINVESASGNESSIGEGSGATIDPDDKYNLNGPVIHIGVNSINESASDLEKLSPEDNPSGKITIDLRNTNDANAHQTADEGIPMTITIGGENSGAKYGAGNPKDASGNEDLRSDVDYYLSGDWQNGTDADGNACLVGKITVTMADGSTQQVDAFRYDDLTNNKTEIKFEMPKGGVSTEIGYTANDDLFESEPGKDNFEVSVTLPPKGQDVDGNDIAYGEATVNNPSGNGPSDWLTSIPETGKITEDVRDGLNPADFDGPFVKLEGTETINESGSNATASYKVSLHDPNVGTSGDAFAATENVTVSVKISSESDTFKMSDLNFKDPACFQNLAKQADGTWKVEVRIVDGEGNESWTNMTIAADGKSATVDVVVPAGQSEANFSLPALDDYYGGGRGSASDPASSSKNDSNDESFSLTITGVTGNEARVENGDVNTHGKVETTITDDFSEAANKYGTQDGPTVNVVIGQNLPDADSDGYKEVKEGSSYNLTLKLTDANNDAFKIDAGHVAYDAPAGNVLQEAMTVTMNFGGTAIANGSANQGTNDYTIYLKNTAINLNVEQDYSVDFGSGYVVKAHSDGQGNLTITVPAGTTIDAAGNIAFPGNSGLSVTITNDAFSEPSYHFNEQTGKIELAPGGANDTFEVKVSDVYGHESVAGKGDKVEILDAAKYYLGIKDDATTEEGGDLTFTLQLYNASGNGTSTTTASGLKQDTLVQLKFSPKGDLTEGGASHGNLSGYENNPASYQQDYDLEAIKVSLQGQGYGVIDVRLVDPADPSQGFYVTLNVPPSEWSDGKYELKVPTIKDTITESDEYLNVDVVAVGGNDIFKHPNSNCTHKEGEITEANIGVEISVVGTDVIYEDPDHGASVKNNPNRPQSSYDANKDGAKDATEGDAGNTWNTASYTIQIKTPDYEESGTGDGLVDQTFTFKINLLDGSANYGADFQWGWQQAGIDPTAPGGLDALNSFLNLPDGVKVIGVENNGKTLKLEVSKDTKYEDIESGIKVNVAAKDDSLSESSENYKVTITSPSQEGHAEIGGQHTQNTNIVDDNNNHFKDGFQVGVGQTTVNESEGFVNVPIILYDNDGYPFDLATSPNGGEAINVTLNGVPTTMYLPVGYTLSQYMTITLGFGSANDNATGNKDYDANVTQYSFPKGYTWEVVEMPGGGYVLQGHAKVELTDDRLSEGPEDFTVKIENVTNNESFPYQNTKEDAPGSTSNQITITDDNIDPANTGNTIGQTGVKDGPTLINFDPTTKLVEPVDTSNPGNPATGSRSTEYRMQFDQVASEPILVMLNLGGEATLGQDFTLGDGIYQVGSTLTADQLANLNTLIAGSDKYLKIEFDTDGLTIKSVTTTASDGTTNSHDSGYFVVVPKGSAEAKFTVNILHDNDEKAIEQVGDVDHGKENIVLEITDIAGSESWIGDDNQHKVSDNNIQDDMRGPIVSISGDSSVGYNNETHLHNTAEYKVSMTNTATENVKVYINIMDNENGLNGSRYETSGLQHDANGWYVIIAPGQTEAKFTVTPNGGDFFYVKQAGVSGGEALSGGGFIFTDIGGEHGGGTIGHYVVNLGDDVVVVEGNAGETPAGLGGSLRVPESMIKSDSYSDCTIKFVTLGGSASEGTDYRIEHSITLTGSQIKELVDQAIADGKYSGSGNFEIDLGDYLKDIVNVVGDTLIEGNENVIVGIIDVSNGTVGNHPTTNVTIIDDDDAYFHITPVATGDVDGDNVVREGGEMRFEVQLVDKDGNPLQLAEGIDIRVQINGGQGEGSDFTLKTDIVTIGPDGKGYVTVNFPNDYLTENDKPINITVTEVVNSDLNSPSMLEKIHLDGEITVGGETVSSNNGEAILRDDYTGTDTERTYDDGPTVSIRPVGGSTLTEGTSMSFMIRVDMVPDEDVQIVLQLGGNIEQLKYFDEHGNNWTGGDKYINLVDIKGNIIGKALLNDDGTCTVTLPKGHSQVLVQVQAADDTITEPNHEFTVKIKETHGGETEGHFDTSETVVSIKDNMNGPLVVLTANDPEITEEAGHAEFTIALQGRTGNGSTSSNGSSLAADEDITITLQMNDTWMEATRQGGKVEYLGSDGNWHEVTVNGSNQFKVTVPAGDTDLKVRVTVNDNSELDGKMNLEMTVIGTEGGESAVVKGLSFANNRTGEDGYGITYSLDCTENSSASDSIVAVTLNNVDLTTLKTITLYGQTFNPNSPPEGYTIIQSGNSVIITSTIHAGSNLDTNLTVNFKGNSDTANGYKEQMTISVGGSRVAGTVITDEPANSSTLEGPLVGLELAAGHLNDPDNPKVTEGENVTGKLVVQMPNLPGDASATSGNIVITLQVSQNPDGTYSKITVNGQEYTPTAAGTVQITVASGTTIGANGKIELDFSAKVPDNALANNPDFNIKVNDVSAPGYESAKADPNTGSVNLGVENEASAADGPAFTINNNAGSSAIEGDTITFNLASSNTCWKQAKGSLEAKVEVSGLQPGDKVTDANGNVLFTEPATGGTGIYEGTVNISSTTNSASGSVKVVSADLNNPVAGREVTVEVKDVVYKTGDHAGESVFENVDSGSSKATIISNDGIQFKMQADFDAMSNELMFTVALAAVGGYAPAGNVLDEPVSFKMNLDGLADAEKTTLADQISSTPNVSATYENGEFTVTLEAGHPTTGSLDFTVPVTPGAEYDISIGHVQAGNLTGSAVDSAHDSFAFNSIEGHSGEVEGTLGNDIIFALNGVDSTLLGGEGDDILIGGTGNTTLDGGAGNDILIAGSGEDILIGGDGTNTFVWKADGLGGDDSILDFKSTDTIDLRDLFSNFGDPKDLDGLVDNGHIKFDQNTDNEKAIDIKISTDDMNNGGTVEQIITVNFAEHDDQSYDQLQALLYQQILTNSN